jgi:OmpR-family two-component system manganese-sensing sensor histidine kinase
MFRETRRRLALWYTVVTAVLLLLFASGFYWYVRDTLIERVDDTLHHVVEVVERSLVVETVFGSGQRHHRLNVDASFGNNVVAVEDDRIDLEWFDATGRLLWSTRSETLDLPLHVFSNAETGKVGTDEVLRQLTERLDYQGELLGYLRVSHPWFEVAKPTRDLVIDLAVGLSIMIGFVAGVGWFLSRLAIEPLQESYQYLRQFTADASHELRNPLALIQTTVQVALSDPTMTPTEQRQQLEVVERLTRRLGNLVNDLLFLARQDSGIIQPQWQSCPLDALLMDVVEEQTPAAQARQVRLTLDLGDGESAAADRPEPFTLWGDYDQLARLFSNLVNNGLQHTPPGGQVTLTLVQGVYHGMPSLQVQVQDNGTGIPEQAQPHIFERFYRADPARPRTTEVASTATHAGTGLGLAIAKAICETHQGQIRVDSKPGQGTTFQVTFPQTLPKLKSPSPELISSS